MARFDIEIGASDKGGNSELQETIGLLEKLVGLKKGLTVDLFKAESADDIARVGQSLTSVNVEIGKYMNLATKATDAWKDNRTAQILDNLSTRLAVTNTNAKAFGDGVANQTSQLRAYQQAFDQLIANGLDRADTEVIALETHIRSLTNTINAGKTAAAQTAPLDALSVKLKQISTDTKLAEDSQKRGQAEIRAYQTAINGLIKAGLEPTSAEVRNLQTSIAALNNQMKQDAAAAMNGRFAETGFLVQDAENKVKRLQIALRSATSEASIIKLNKKLEEARTELTRLAYAGTQAGAAMSTTGRSSNMFGVEIARIAQDLPYSSRAFGAISDNFGSIGNNIQRATELFPGFMNQVRASVVEKQKATTAANMFRGALAGMFSGMNGVIFAVSALTAAYTIWQALSQKRQRELDREKKKEEELIEVLRKRVATMDAVTQSTAAGRRDAAEEIARLNMLRTAIESELVPRDRRLAAVKDLKKEFPKHFKNLSDEKLLAGEVALEYDKLTKSLLQTALAQAAVAKAVELAREMIDAETSISGSASDRTRIAKEQARLTAQQTKLTEEYLEARKSATQAEMGALDFWYKQERRKIQSPLTELNRELEELNKSNQDAAALLVNNQKEINALGERHVDLVAAGALFQTDQTKETTKTAKEVKRLGDEIKNVFTPDSSVGSEGLTADLNKARDQYKKHIYDLETETNKWRGVYAKQAKDGVITQAEANKEIIRVEADAAAEREQINEGYYKKTETLMKGAADEYVRLMTEAEDRAGLERSRTLQSEMQRDQMWWEKRKAELIKQGADEDKIKELQAQSENQIRLKYARMTVEEVLNLERRTARERSRILMRRLDEDTAAEIAAAEGNEAKIFDIRKKYVARYQQLQAQERDTRIQLSFDGTAMSTKIAAVDEQITLLRESFDQGLISSVSEFQAKISELENQRQQFQLWQNTIEGVSGAFGDFTSDILFDTDNALKNLGETFKGLAANMVSGLVQIGARMLINQALGKASMVATTAASAATASAVAAAWATPAALVTAASFGTNIAPAAAALGGFVASTKALSALPGFAAGGYTGNIGRKKIAGVVHGQEFVVNASATENYLPLLKAMNSGRDISGLMPRKIKSGATSGLKTGAKQILDVRVDGTIRNNDIRLSNNRAVRNEKKFGRGGV